MSKVYKEFTLDARGGANKLDDVPVMRGAEQLTPPPADSASGASRGEPFGHLKLCFKMCVRECRTPGSGTSEWEDVAMRRAM